MQHKYKYSQLADVLFTASNELLKSIGVVIERPQDLYVCRDKQYFQDKAGFYYCYECKVRKKIDGFLGNLQDAINEELYNRTISGHPVPVVLKMEETSNGFSLLVTIVNDEETLFELYGKVMHYRIVRVNLD